MESDVKTVVEEARLAGYLQGVLLLGLFWSLIVMMVVAGFDPFSNVPNSRDKWA